MRKALRTPEAVAGLLALVLALLHQWLIPLSGTDLAAQLARADFARAHPLTPVDFSWYAGVHPFGYSLLSPWLMALLGVGPCNVLAAVLGAVLLTRLLRDQLRPLLVAVLAAAFSVADIVSGRTTFALGAVALLAALLCRERRGWAVLLAALSGLLSPVAAAFLGFCAAVLVLHRRPGGWTLGLAASVPVGVVGLLFPGGGVQPFSVDSGVPAIAVALVLARVTRSPLVRTGSLLYAVAVVGFLAHADAFGSNVLRLGLLAAGAVVAATVRPPALMGLLLVGALAWQTDPVHGDLSPHAVPSATALRAELVALGSQRAEVVAPREHRESWQVAVAVPLARGWGRQVDYRDNRLFYDEHLSARDYLAWLHRRAVDHVAVPRRGPLDFGARTEARLLAKPVPGLTEVWRDRDWVVYAVDSPTPLAEGATVVSSTRTGLTLRAAAAGDVRVRVRWSRWLSLQGPGCVEADGTEVRLKVSAPGTLRLGSSLRPHGRC